MITLRGIYDGKQIRLLEPIPESKVSKESTVLITFYEEEKVPQSTKQAIYEMVEGNLLDLDEVIGDI